MIPQKIAENLQDITGVLGKITSALEIDSNLPLSYNDRFSYLVSHAASIVEFFRRHQMDLSDEEKQELSHLLCELKRELAHYWADTRRD